MDRLRFQPRLVPWSSISGTGLIFFSILLTSRIAVPNGYPEQSLTKAHRTPATAARYQSDNKIPVKVPFKVSNDFRTEVRSCIRKAGLDSVVRMIEVPPANLKARLVRNLLYNSSCNTRQCIFAHCEEGDCMVSG